VPSEEEVPLTQPRRTTHSSEGAGQEKKNSTGATIWSAHMENVENDQPHQALSPEVHGLISRLAAVAGMYPSSADAHCASTGDLPVQSSAYDTDSPRKRLTSTNTRRQGVERVSALNNSLSFANTPPHAVVDSSEAEVSSYSTGLSFRNITQHSPAFPRVAEKDPEEASENKLQKTLALFFSLSASTRFAFFQSVAPTLSQIELDVINKF
jgi:hypothetical protein